MKLLEETMKLSWDAFIINDVRGQLLQTVTAP